MRAIIPGICAVSVVKWKGLRVPSGTEKRCNHAGWQAFADRMPSEHWMIIDDTRKTACVHPKDGTNSLRYLTDAEFETLRKTEEYEDEYTDMWKTFSMRLESKSARIISASGTSSQSGNENMRWNSRIRYGSILVEKTGGTDTMAYFYFTRHGQTIWNVENKICGATDIALTELGHTQAKELGERIKAEGIHIDKILYSPLMRAADTAKHIAEVTGVSAEEEMRLKEQNFGRYESTPRNGAEFSVAKAQFVNSYDGGESMLKLSQRIYNLLDDIKKEAESEGTVYLLVAHNGISRIIESYFHDMTNEEFAAFGIKNCELRKYEF